MKALQLFSLMCLVSTLASANELLSQPEALKQKLMDGKARQLRDWENGQAKFEKRLSKEYAKHKKQQAAITKKINQFDDLLTNPEQLAALEAYLEELTRGAQEFSDATLDKSYATSDTTKKRQFSLEGHAARFGSLSVKEIEEMRENCSENLVDILQELSFSNYREVDNQLIEAQSQEACQNTLRKIQQRQASPLEQQRRLLRYNLGLDV